jgi:translation initiation factor 2 subunit 3
MSKTVTAQTEKAEEREQTPKRAIPSQPVVNIGTSGHVDHGKCERIDQYVLLDGVPVKGYEVLQRVLAEGTLLSRVDGGEVYKFDCNKVISISQTFEPVKADSLFYFQRYCGPMYSIRGATGRSISVTPEHPLLINRGGTLSWIRAKEIRRNDYLAFLSYIPLEQSFTLPDPLPNLGRIYKLVTWDDYKRLDSLTCGFSDFSSLMVEDFETVRIIFGISSSHLQQICHMSQRAYADVLAKKKVVTVDIRNKLSAGYKSLKPAVLAPYELLVEQKSDSRRIRKLTLIETIDAEIVKWFAFVWAEGSSRRGHIEVTQTLQMEMLREFLEISKEKLGLEPMAYPRGRYLINNTPFVDYISIKFGFKPGNELTCGITDWVCKLPRSLKSTFLRWFFTLDGEFSERSGQISIRQLNERNVVIMGYLLHSFGIVPKFSAKRAQTTGQGKKEYFRIVVSGRKSLQLFADAVGFEDETIQKRLLEYLKRIKKESKETNQSIPIDTFVLRSIFRDIGLVKVGFSQSSEISRMKDSVWYKAYESAAITKRISRTRLRLLLNACDEQIRSLERSLPDISSNGSYLRRYMELAGFSLEAVASQLGYSRRKLMRILRDGYDKELDPIVSLLRRQSGRLLRVASAMLEQLRALSSSPLEFDRITSVTQEQYDGLVFDLNVPDYANFIGGNGAIVCHNTTLTQAITGIWTSAHSEELRRGITIKVGYADAAFYKCDGCGPPDCFTTSPECGKCGGKATLLRVVSFVDTPGHESLMANMLSGAAVMDGSILVIAANEKVPQPQTREHLLALQMLGMKHIVIAQNKIDLVSDEEATENYSGIKKFVAGSVAENAPIIPISAQHHLNIDALIEALEENIPTPPRNESAPPLMQVLRSFDVNHPGLSSNKLSGGVLGGTLLRGFLSVGDEIEIRPGIIEEGSSKAEPIVTKVNTLMSSAGKTERVHPGGLIAIGTLLDPFYTRSDSLVGAVIGKPNQLPPVFDSLSMEVKLFETAVGTQELVKVEKIRMQEILRLNIGTGVTVGIVSSARDSIIDAKLKKPVCASKGDRIAISRRIGERWRLIGAGTVR